MIALEGEFRNRRYPLTLRCDGLLHGAFGPVASDARVWVVWCDGRKQEAKMLLQQVRQCGYRNVTVEQREGATR